MEETRLPNLEVGQTGRSKYLFHPIWLRVFVKSSVFCPDSAVAGHDCMIAKEGA